MVFCAVMITAKQGVFGDFLTKCFYRDLEINNMAVVIAAASNKKKSVRPPPFSLRRVLTY